jgi:hypothetical protein
MVRDAPVLTPPVISLVATSNLTPTSATVTWQTDMGADSVVEYGLTTAYGSSVGLAPLVSQHAVPLVELESSTTYHYRVTSTNALGQMAVSADATFTTFGEPVPVNWTNLVNATVVNGKLTKLNGCEDCENAGAVSREMLSASTGKGFLEFRVTDLTKNYFIGLSHSSIGTTSSEIAYAMWQGNGVTITENGVSRTFFPVAVNDLLRITVENGVVKYLRNGVVVYTSTVAPTYPLRVDTSLRSKDVTVTDAVFSADPYTPTVPVISGVVASPVQDTSAEISWNTDLAATSQVDYGFTDDYGSSTTYQNVFGMQHSQTLTGLLPGTTYHYRVLSWSIEGLANTSGDHTFTTAASPTLQPVVWTDLVNATVTAGVLQKTGGCSGCEDAGAASTQSISAADGYVEFTVTDLLKDYYIGLSNGNAGTTSAPIKFAMWQGNGVSIVESGVVRTVFPVNVNDVLRIGVVQGVVKYYRNGIIVYTSAVAPTYPLRVDTTLRTSNVTVTNAIIVADPFVAAPPNITNVGVSSLTDVSGVVTWSTDQASDSQVDYGTTTNYGTSTPLNGATVFAHSQLLTGLTPSTTYHYRVRSTSAGFTTTSGDFTFTTLALQPPAVPVIWTSVVNATVTGNVLQKTSGLVRGLDSGAVSQQTLSEGYVEITATEVNSWRVVGLSHTSTGTHDLEIQYSLWLHDGVVEVRENPTFGVDIAQATTPLAVNDVLRISVSSGVVRYWKNGVVFYTSTFVPTLPLLFDTTLLDLNSTIVNAVISVGSSPVPEPSLEESAGRTPEPAEVPPAFRLW